MHYYYLTAIITAIVVAFLVITGCISDYFNERFYSLFPDEIKQGGYHSLRVASPRPPVSFKLSKLVANLVKLAIVVLLSLFISGCEKHRQYCWQCMDKNGTDFELCDKTRQYVQDMTARDSSYCTQK